MRFVAGELPPFLPQTLVAALVATVASAAILGWLRPPLVALAARRLRRRPGRAVALVCGLALPVAVVVGALGAGDSAAATLRTVATARSGTVDEIIVLNPLGQSLVARFDPLGGSLYGGSPAAERGFFAAAEFDRLREGTRASGVIAAAAPAIADEVTVAGEIAGGPGTKVALLALAIPDPEAFGALVTDDGRAIRLEALAPDAIALNAAAARAIGAATGDELLLRSEGGPAGGWRVRVAGISAGGGIGGAQPLVFAPLARYQELLGRAGQINLVLVANRDGRPGGARGEAASRELRWLLIDRARAQQLREALARPEAQRVLDAAAGRATGRERERLLALRAEAAHDPPTERFVGLVAELRLRQRLAALSGEIRDDDTRRAAFTALFDLTTLTVLEPEREGFDEAARLGAAVTRSFLAVGLFPIAAAVLLAHFVLTAPATDRGGAPDRPRPPGARRSPAVGARLVEVGGYAAAVAGLGALAGAGLARLIVAVLGEPAAALGIRPIAALTPGGLLPGVAVGMLAAGAILTVAAPRATRHPSPATPGARGLEGRALVLAGLGGLLTLGAAALWRGWRGPLLAPLALSCALLGAIGGLLALAPARPRGVRGDEARGGPLATAGAAALVLVWLQALSGLPVGEASPRSNLVAVSLSGLALALAGVWLCLRGCGPFLATLGAALPWPPALRTVPRPAIGSLRDRGWRAALTAGMFAVVLLATVAALTIAAPWAASAASRRAAIPGTDPAGPAAGFGSGMHTAAASAASPQAPAEPAVAAVAALPAIGARAATGRSGPVSHARGGDLSALDERRDAPDALAGVLIRLVWAGFLTGLAAAMIVLGILGVQVAGERRQQPGRAGGAASAGPRVALSLAVELAGVTAAGIASGLAAGCLAARALAATLPDPAADGALPWGQIGTVTAVAALGALVPIAGCAWRAALLTSAEARQRA